MPVFRVADCHLMDCENDLKTGTVSGAKHVHTQGDRAIPHHRFTAEELKPILEAIRHVLGIECFIIACFLMHLSLRHNNL